ncbi:AAA family ATPase [Actibacterium sp. XHP0104]|uniref:AAA family ATPase n=1 Tax=Actibacterium sp. XHP0104 TaxID=2984335 RepID=UPI0021E9931E|nr:AAA family ATPase [Actibacterium sp. XHP0104]MCV2880486.1 AAA family ATPase [Actibacterium sp. XHP0104]
MTPGRRIHVLGASGSGTSTLARALASKMATQAFDTDDFYWRPSDPAFQRKRPVKDRLALMEEMFLPRRDWILSGSFAGWGDPVIPRLTHVVFLTLPAGQRLARLRARERRRYGKAIEPGGERAAAFASFLDWAMQYDDPGFTGRTRHVHEEWLSQLPCPVIRIDATQSVDQMVAQAMAELDQPVPAS